jgi:ABC-type transport system substrate-binding protein
MKRALWALHLVAVLIVAGCQPGEFSKKAAETKREVFRYPIVTSPTSLDPGVVQDGDTIDVLQQVFEGLVGWGEDNRVTPVLAESWTVSDDGRTYTFKIKPDAKFSSGRAVTAEDFKFCIERNCDPKFSSPTAGTYLADIVGVREKLGGKATEVSGVKVIDPQTLAITIDAPRPYFLGKLTYPTAFVFDREKVTDPTKEINQITELVGTGPYTYAEFVPDQIIKLAANPGYHGGAPKVAGIERPVVKDPSKRLSLYKAGELDLTMLERQDIKGVEADAELKDHLKLFDRPALWYIGLNTNMYPALKDVRVRQAIAQAIDIDEIVNNLLGGVNKKADGIVPPGVFGYRGTGKTWAYNPEAARRLLAEAGYPNGRGIPELEIYFREARPDIETVASKVVTDLKRNLNINVKTRQMEWAGYLEKHNKKEIPFFHMRWAADYLDAENFLSTLLAGYGSENKVYYENPEYDDLCRRADSSSDEEERKRLYAQAEDIVLRDAPFIPVYFQRDAELIRPRVKGIRSSVFGHLPHTTITLE